MNSEDLPALYRAASKASAKSQSAYFNCMKLYGAASVGAAALTMHGIDSELFAILAAALFGLGLGVSVLMAVRRYERTWYRARAIAESVKTASWRYMMRADPYGDVAESPASRRAFASVLKRILDEHTHLAHELADDAAAPQITQKMSQIRELPLRERIGVYRSGRIADQQEWYASNAAKNRHQWSLFFGAFIVLQAIAILITLVRIAQPSPYLSPAIFSVTATVIFGWASIKRYREIAAAYAMTAHEIGIAATELTDVTDDQTFSDFVGDTENAFSREHTQWVARKDN